VQATPSVIKGLCSSDPNVQANPQWWVLEVFDGHGPHTMSMPAMQLCYDSKILPLQEEGDSSHVNQPTTSLLLMPTKVWRMNALQCFAGARLWTKVLLTSVESHSCWSVCHLSFESWNMDQLFQSMQHGSTDKCLLSALVQKDWAFYPSRTV
jgi:hypothetical protein